MRLHSLKLTNFRGYKYQELEFAKITTLIGRNDAGKSTLLEALEIFFNNKNIKIDHSDLSISTVDDFVEIACSFSHLPDEIIVDTVKTDVREEYLLNKAGHLEIVKRYEFKGKMPKESVFIRAYHPDDEMLRDLLTLKQTELRSRLKAVGGDDSSNQKLNSSIRRGIRNAVGVSSLSEHLIPAAKEDAKALWDVLKGQLPLFALFQSDRKSHDEDPEITEPMDVAIREALRTVEEQLDEIRERVRIQATEVANRTLEKLSEMSPGIAEQLTPEFKKEQNWTSLFKITFNDKRGISINKRGSGIRRLILLNFFRAEVEKRREEGLHPSIIYAFEEPETSQHPDHQCLLMNAFVELSEAPGIQVVVTTHTPALAGLVPSESVRLVVQEGWLSRVESGSSNVLRQAAETLGVLPDPVNLSSAPQVILCVEGIHDISAFKAASRCYHAGGVIANDVANDPRVVCIPLGGSTLKGWVNERYLRNFGLPEVHLYDRDDPNNPPYEASAELVNARGDGSVARLTRKKELENYFHPNAISRVLGIDTVFDDWEDVPVLVGTLLNRKTSFAKKALNEDVAAAMTLVEYQERDNDSEWLDWFGQLQARLPDQENDLR